MSRLHLPPRLSGLVLATALLATMPLAGWAQAKSATTGAAPMDPMPGMDHGSMEGMAMPSSNGAAPSPAAPVVGESPKRAPPAAAAQSPRHGMQDAEHASMPGMEHNSMPGMGHGAMPGMEHGAMPGMEHSSMPGMEHGSMPGMDRNPGQSTDHGSTPGASDMRMGPMQGGSPPPDARDPDYSAGIDHGPSRGMGMAMDDNPRVGKVLLDQLEAFHGREGNGQRWDAEGWYGNDYDKLWFRTEGERAGGALEHGDLEALWNHAVAAFWSTQLGVRTEAGPGPNRAWAAFGIQGLAPYWFEMEATGYVGPAGRTAARVRAEYELLLTQRLILQPEFEANLYGRDDPTRRLGSGLSDAELGLRLRYEIRREFAPYIGMVWARRFGGTADFARARGEGVFDRQWVAGFRIWF